jgi:L-fuculose-phosphate aldolase
MTSPYSVRNQIVSLGRKLAERQLIAGTDGNISVRLDSHRILITPAGAAKGDMVSDDLVTVDLEGRQLQGNNSPSSEMAMHLYVYRKRPDITACVHAHPPHATAFAVAGEPLPDGILPEVVLFVGPVPMTEYAPPGTEAVPDSLSPYVDHANAFLLRNHGLLTLGRTLEEAWHRHETIEHYARILILSRQVGRPRKIPAEDLERLSDMRRTLEEN